MSKNILITGGVGFLGEHLTNYLLKKNYKIIVFDKLQYHQPTIILKKIVYVKGDILSERDLVSLFKEYRNFTAIYHLAAALPNKAVPEDLLWRTNVNGTINVMKKAIEYGVKSFIFTSSNTVYGKPLSNPVTEDTPLKPLEIYGKSKVQAEKQLEKYKKYINIQIFRCPVISGIGRLGLQGILYEFISENKNIYLLGSGTNKYQFIDAKDLCVALEKASHKKGFSVYNIGADNIVSLKSIYSFVINHAKSSSKIISLPKKPAEYMLAILNALHISPIGPYQYTMLGLSLYADLTKVKKQLNWKPTKTNTEMFIENYKWYIEHKNKLQTFDAGNNNSANKSIPKLRFLRILKLLS